MHWLPTNECFSQMAQMEFPQITLTKFICVICENICAICEKH